MSTILALSYPSSNNQLKTLSNPMHQVAMPKRQTMSYVGNCSTGNDHLARPYTKSKKIQCLKQQMLLAQLQEAGIQLSRDQLAILADIGERIDYGPGAFTLTTNALFQADKVKVYDSDCDDVPNAQPSFMANILSYGLDALAVVHNPDNVDNSMINQDLKNDLFHKADLSAEQPFLVEKDLVIMTLKEELRKLEGKSVVTCRESVNNPKVIDPVLHKLETPMPWDYVVASKEEGWMAGREALFFKEKKGVRFSALYLQKKRNLLDSGFKLTGFSDADYTGCKYTFKSTSGGTKFLGEKLVSWSSKKQDSMALLITEAEYVSLSACCALVLGCGLTFKSDYGFYFNKIPIYFDSKSAIAISCNPVQHLRTKHIAVRYHFINEHVEIQNQRDLPRDTPIDRIKVLRHKVKGGWKNRKENCKVKGVKKIDGRSFILVGENRVNDIYRKHKGLLHGYSGDNSSWTHLKMESGHGKTEYVLTAQSVRQYKSSKDIFLDSVRAATSRSSYRASQSRQHVRTEGSVKGDIVLFEVPSICVHYSLCPDTAVVRLPMDIRLKVYLRKSFDVLMS
ncbi:hypothetical protein Tco_0891510 [Tanacetum coccineum]|uniref:Uncharacterized protein n=1 Tax=Tanacetum coccineum TaxID=301880 RepID=A0ABQ5C6G6_9ASTR